LIFVTKKLHTKLSIDIYIKTLVVNVINNKTWVKY